MQIRLCLLILVWLQLQSTKAQNTTATRIKEAGAKPVKLGTKADSIQYILCAFLAHWLNINGFQVTDPILFSKGLNDGIFNRPSLVPDSILSPTVATFQREVVQKRLAIQEKQFFSSLRDKPGIGQLPNGTRFIILKTGHGFIAQETDSILVHLTAKLIDGTLVENTYEGKKPFSATINSFFPGLNAALAMMPEGSKWQLFVPSILAYGEKGTSLIPPNRALILEVELLTVKSVRK